MQSLYQSDVRAAIHAVLCTKLHLLQVLNKQETQRTEIYSNLWLLVFERVFQELPQNLPDTPAYYAVGVTDPRWDMLLHKEQGMRIFDEVLARCTC